MVKGFNCCGDTPTDGAQACECIPQTIEDIVTPQGTRLLAVDPERMYRTGDGKLWLTKADYKSWSEKTGWRVNPLVWFVHMGHGPLPGDVELTDEDRAELGIK